MHDNCSANYTTVVIFLSLNMSSQILKMSSQNATCIDILSRHIQNLISSSERFLQYPPSDFPLLPTKHKTFSCPFKFQQLCSKSLLRLLFPHLTVGLPGSILFHGRPKDFTVALQVPTQLKERESKLTQTQHQVCSDVRA